MNDSLFLLLYCIHICHSTYVFISLKEYEDIFLILQMVEMWEGRFRLETEYEEL